jgi:hypothetical protein
MNIDDNFMQMLKMLKIYKITIQQEETPGLELETQ